MRVYEIICKKKRGQALTNDEIKFVVNGFTNGDVPDYQMSALLMAICFNGMTAEETAALTMAMVDSGERVDLTELSQKYGTTVDKHSTGGVGDKTTLAVVPIVAACGVPLAKMSGRGLGHTGGTIDKLEAIPGFRTKLSGAEFMQIVKNIGACIAGQSANLAPADKKIYALRDVTATVDSIPLIAASIMSKKIAAGADAILLDVKTGSGAFMKNLRDAKNLAQQMVDIGNACGRKTSALITDMSVPLGCAIGNSLELSEVVQFLKGELNDPLTKNLRDLCEELSATMLFLAKKGDINECRAMVKAAIASGDALKKLQEMVRAQGGDVAYLNEPQKAAHIVTVNSREGGFISSLDTEGIGISAMILGAGRKTPDDEIDYSAGIILKIKHGDFVAADQPLAELHTSTANAIPAATEKFLSSIKFSQTPPDEIKLIYEAIGV
jgi:pyrimidine-nucleoside phosphorylase